MNVVHVYVSMIQSERGKKIKNERADGTSCAFLEENA